MRRIADLHLLTAKPVMYIANVAEDGLQDNPLLRTGARRLPTAQGAACVPICTKIEAEIAELEADERMDFLSDLGLEAPGLDRVIQSGHRLLGLHDYLHSQFRGGARLDGSGRDHRTASCGSHPYGLRTGFHSRGSDRIRRLCFASEVNRAQKKQGRMAPGRQGLCRAGRGRNPLSIQRVESAYPGPLTTPRWFAWPGRSTKFGALAEPAELAIERSSLT